MYLWCIVVYCRCITSRTVEWNRVGTDTCIGNVSVMYQWGGQSRTWNRRWMIHYWYVTNTLMIHVSQTPVDSPLKWPVDTCIVMYQQCIRTVSHWMSSTTVGDVTHQIWAIVSMTWYICDTIPNTLNLHVSNILADRRIVVNRYSYDTDLIRVQYIVSWSAVTSAQVIHCIVMYHECIAIVIWARVRWRGRYTYYYVSTACIRIMIRIRSWYILRYKTR